ncbi:hypothetical protein IQ235_06655 [Oscillatoriales cyanobacterium LEGE 11467]|uniref:Uncharacterized protein n=1 Tax=Zarconia navalis LEGE 11467 TaxID=1828826 RepID=A0A928VVV2_9CYAN|nr:hypothetical protein [Zarconia navalis]MBE9040469.1 hypothetical protein [Zarconia navalis LEGE 11467]
MTISKEQAKPLLEDLIFTGEKSRDWVQDVWALSPTLAESAASLVDMLDLVMAMMSEAQIEELLRQLYRDNPDAIEDSKLRDDWHQWFEN